MCDDLRICKLCVCSELARLIQHKVQQWRPFAVRHGRHAGCCCCCRDTLPPANCSCTTNNSSCRTQHACCAISALVIIKWFQDTHRHLNTQSYPLSAWCTQADALHPTACTTSQLLLWTGPRCARIQIDYLCLEVYQGRNTGAHVNTRFSRLRGERSVLLSTTLPRTVISLKAKTRDQRLLVQAAGCYAQPPSATGPATVGPLTDGQLCGDCFCC